MVRRHGSHLQGSKHVAGGENQLEVEVALESSALSQTARQMLERTKRDLDLRRQMLDQQFEGAETKGGVRRERHRCHSERESGWDYLTRSPQG